MLDENTYTRNTYTYAYIHKFHATSFDFKVSSTPYALLEYKRVAAAGRRVGDSQLNYNPHPRALAAPTTTTTPRGRSTRTDLISLLAAVVRTKIKPRLTSTRVPKRVRWPYTMHTHIVGSCAQSLGYPQLFTQKRSDGCSTRLGGQTSSGRADGRIECR